MNAKACRTIDDYTSTSIPICSHVASRMQVALRELLACASDSTLCLPPALTRHPQYTNSRFARTSMPECNPIRDPLRAVNGALLAPPKGLFFARSGDLVCDTRYNEENGGPKGLYERSGQKVGAITGSFPQAGGYTILRKSTLRCHTVVRHR